MSVCVSVLSCAPLLGTSKFLCAWALCIFLNNSPSAGGSVERTVAPARSIATKYKLSCSKLFRGYVVCCIQVFRPFGMNTSAWARAFFVVRGIPSSMFVVVAQRVRIRFSLPGLKTWFDASNAMDFRALMGLGAAAPCRRFMAGECKNNRTKGRQIVQCSSSHDIPGCWAKDPATGKQICMVKCNLKPNKAYPGYCVNGVSCLYRHGE